MSFIRKLILLCVLGSTAGLSAAEAQPSLELKTFAKIQSASLRPNESEAQKVKAIEGILEGAFHWSWDEEAKYSSLESLAVNYWRPGAAAELMVKTVAGIWLKNGNERGWQTLKGFRAEMKQNLELHEFIRATLDDSSPNFTQAERILNIVDEALNTAPCETGLRTE